MAKFHKVKEGVHVFHCPGCNDVHTIYSEGSGNKHPRLWQFNNDKNSPTISPSLLVRNGHYITEYKVDRCWCDYHREHPEEKENAPNCYRCHSFIRDGKIQFLSDCSHEFAGQTVEIGDFETLHPNWKD